MKRDIGITTGQMQRAKRGAFYIWVNSHLQYPMSLAISLKRADLKIVSPHWLDTDKCRAYRQQIIIDHATHLTSKQYDILDKLRDGGIECLIQIW